MPDILSFTQELIRRVSLTPDDAGCQELIKNRLKQAGFVCESLRFNNVDNLWATHSNSADGDNLNKNNNNEPVLVFLGHTDVVPAGDIASWNSDPFTPTIKDDYLYGRGVADMKGSVAAFVIALEQFVREYPHHKGTVAILLTSDEEGPSIDGVKKVAELFKQREQKITWCITGEPSSTHKLGDLMRVGRRGTLSAKLIIKGIQGHVAYPEKARNPIHQAFPALHELTAYSWDTGYYSFPPSSLQISNINAGTGANNVIPGELECLFNIRYNPHWNAEKLQHIIEEILNKHALEYQIQWHQGGEPFYTRENSLRKIAREVLTEFNAGIAPEESTGGGTSDARFIAPLGAQCIEIGPVNATIHQVNESIYIPDLEKLPALYLELTKRLLVD